MIPILGNFIAFSYTDKHLFQKALRRLHEQGLEGAPEGICWISVNGIEQRLYGFKVDIPKTWTEQQLMDFTDGTSW